MTETDRIAVPEAFPAPGDVAGRRVVVTGAGRGLGSVLATAFDRAGASVALVARTLDDLESTAASFENEHLTIAADVSRPEDNERVVATVVEAWQGIDVWIANAGISPAYVDAAELPAGLWQRTIDVNLTGVFAGVQAAVQAMGEGGRVIVTGSVIGARPARGLSAYAASKAGVTALVRCLALELSDRGITVNEVSPGWFDSPLARPFQHDPGRAEAILGHTALGRWGASRDLPGAYLFLASESSAFITGATIPVDGGYLLP